MRIRTNEYQRLLEENNEEKESFTQCYIYI